MEHLITKNENYQIKIAFDRAIQNYIQARRQKIPEFIQTHFSISGAAKINKKALGLDLIKAPLNVVWAVPYTALRVTSLILHKVGFKQIKHLNDNIPAGFKTAVQEEINRLIFLELLNLPYKDKQVETDALFVEILEQPEIKRLLQAQLDTIHSKSKQEGFKQALEKRLTEYSVNRIAVSEIAGTLISLATGAGILGKMTPGGISFGTALAATIAQQSAISSFYFGSSLGGIYYGIFPASASLGLVIASTSATLAVLAIISSFSGIITDPIQAHFGLHEKRLNNLLDSLEDNLLGNDDSELNLRAQYLARVFDLVDLFKTAANTII